MKGDDRMNITHEERLEFLRAYNALKSIVQTLHECSDLWMSDVRKLEKIECLMQSHTSELFQVRCHTGSRINH